MRRLGRWLGWGALAATLTLLGFFLFVLYTESGLSWLLTSALRGSGGSFEASAVRGTLASGYAIDNAVIDLPAVRISAKQIRAEVKPFRLLSGVLQVDSLVLDEAVFSIKAAPAKPTERQALPKLDLPFDLLLRNLDLRNNAITLATDLTDGTQTESKALSFSAGAREISIIRGKLGVKGLAFSHGEFSVTASADFDTTSGWAGEVDSEGQWSLPEVLHKGQLRLAGNAEKMDLGFTLGEGGVVNLEASFDRPMDAAGIEGRLEVERFDPASFGLEAPFKSLDLDLKFIWSERALRVEGPIRVDGQSMQLLGAGLALRGEVLEIGEFALSSEALGAVSGEGEWPLSAAASAGKLKLSTRDLWLGDWRTVPADVVPRITAKLNLQGHTDNWQAKVDGSWRMGERSGPLALAASGTPERIEFAPSRIAMAQSAIDFSGELKLLEPRRFALDLKLSAVDPALFAPEWPGSLDGKLKLEGELGEVVRWKFAVAELTGELREQPVALSGSIAGSGGVVDLSDLDLRWGTGGAKLSVPTPGALAVELRAFDLRQLGAYEGLANGSVSWRPDQDLLSSSRAQLKLEKILIAGVRVGNASVDKLGDFDAQIFAQNIETGKFKLSKLQFEVTGTAAAHSLALSADNERVRLDASLSGAWEASAWSGAVTRMQLTEKGGESWTLADAASLRFDRENIALAPVCLQAGAARVCAGFNRDATTRVVVVNTQDFPLEQLNAWFPDSGAELSGQLDGGGRVSFDAAGKAGGTLDFTVSDGSVRGAETYEQAVPFDGSLRYDSSSGGLAANLRLPGHGSVEVTATGLGPDGSSLDGFAPCPSVVGADPETKERAGTPPIACSNGARIHAKVDIADLSFIDGVTAEVQSVRGSLRGELDGPLDDPLGFSGRLESSELQFELPALGLKATSGKVIATLAGDRLLKLDGKFAIAPGELVLEGVVGLDDTAATELHIRSNNAGLVDLPAVRLAGDTNFVITRRDGGFAIDGGVLLRGGRIDLDRFAPDVPPSEDVVIEDAPVVAPGPPIHAEVSIAFIQAVDLRGYGLEATLGGGLRVTQRPGSRTLAQGELAAVGIYNAYGQKLNIERGRMIFGGGRADNPRFDLLAVKRINRQRVGVRIRGTAKRPLATLYSDPSLDQSETLSYLVLGRALSTASGADGQRLGEYADALETAGGNLIAGSIGKRLGLSAGVESLGSAIGSALVVGKYLSPRFFVGYGTTLLDATQLVILRYQITENIDLELISGREQKASVSWRTER